MKLSESMLRLYAVTDRSWLGSQTLAEQVEAALRGGATCVQLREKTQCREDFLRQAQQLKVLCARYGVPLLINDNVELALEVDADGVHVGAAALRYRGRNHLFRRVRRLIGADKILGVTAKTVPQALRAQQAGAD